MIEQDKWIVADINGTESVGYMITWYQANCQECQMSSFSRTCNSPECLFLCYHMYSCDPCCYSYNNGHICEHIHRVHSLSNVRNNLLSNETNAGVQSIKEKARNPEDSNTPARLPVELHTPLISVSKPPNSG